MLADIARHRVDVVIAVPSMLQRLLDVPEAVRAGHDLSSLQAVLVVRRPARRPNSAHRFMQAFGPCLYNLYGSSETGFGAIATPDDLRAAPGTVGYPPVGTEVRILGPDGQPLPAGQVGRVFLQDRAGVQRATSGGGTKEVIDGYMNTGDLGHLDAAGRLFIDGRADDMVISGGENVFPREVEEVLAGHPAVAEVAVIGVPDEQFGQRLRAFVVARPGATVGAEELRDYLKDRVARFKVPRDFVFLPASAAERARQGGQAGVEPDRTGPRPFVGPSGLVARPRRDRSTGAGCGRPADRRSSATRRTIRGRAVEAAGGAGSGLTGQAPPAGNDLKSCCPAAAAAIPRWEKEEPVKTLADRFRTWYEYERDCNAKSLAMLASVPADRARHAGVPEGRRPDGPPGRGPAAVASPARPLAGAPPPVPQRTRLDDLPALVADTEAAWTAYLGRLDDSGTGPRVRVGGRWTAAATGGTSRAC